MRTSIVRLLAFAAIAVLFVCAPQARAQSAYGYSSLAIYGTTVSSESETDLDYYAESYYGVETDAYLWANSSIVASGSSTSEGETVGLSVSVSVNTSYEIQTNHWVTTYDATPYCFSCVASGEWFAGSMTVNANSYYDEEDDGSVYLGTTYDTGNTDGSAPSISGVDYTTYGGGEVRGTSGYIILYGSNFTTPYGSTSVSMPYGSATYLTYLSDGQINLSYTIPTDTASGAAANIDVSTPYSPDATAGFTVYDPVPAISSLSSSSWNAGSVTTGFTISGSGFGSAPSVSFSDSYISFAPSSAGDTSITGTLTVGSGDPGGSVTLTVTVDSEWGGSSFQSRSGGGSGTATAGGSVVGAPVITGISPDTTMIEGGDTSVTISGLRFGSSCPTVNTTGGLTVTTVSCSTTSIALTISAGDSATISPFDLISVSTAYGTSNDVYFTVNGPYSMEVDQDISGDDPSGYPLRRTVYIVYNVDGTAAPNYTLGENFSWTNSSSACSPTPTPGSLSCSAGRKTDPIGGTFQDSWSLLSPGYSPSGCGIDILDYWQACFGASTDTFGELSGNSHTSYTTIWGYQIVYPSDSGGMPTGYVVPR